MSKSPFLVSELLEKHEKYFMGNISVRDKNVIAPKPNIVGKLNSLSTNIKKHESISSSKIMLRLVGLIYLPLSKLSEYRDLN
jgi:hypothetical protein